MVPAIAESNRLRQKQCENTPFLTKPPVVIFGYLANPMIAQQVINGTYVPPPGTPLIVVDFLAALKRPNSNKKRNEINFLVTEEENKKG